MGDDAAALLRTLGDLLCPGPLLHTPAFYCSLPHAAHGWEAVGLTGWATDVAQLQQAAAAVAAAQAEEERGEVDLTGDGPELPEVPASQLAAATWQAAFVDVVGHWGGWDILLEVRPAAPGCGPRAAHACGLAQFCTPGRAADSAVLACWGRRSSRL